MQEQPATAASNVAKLAKRRPDWELPELHLDLKLSSHDPLQQSFGHRITCPRCNKSRSLYCYDCLAPLTPSPTLRLPCKVSIITHYEEAKSKNTGVHAALLAPDDVVLHSVEQCPAFDPSRAVVLFPSDDATLVGDLDFSSVERVFIVDSRWKKAKHLVQEPQLAGVRRVALKDARTAFWRFHTSGVAEEGVCSIEALYYFFRDLSAAGQLPQEYAGEHYFDDLLWYFVFQHVVVQQKAAARYQERVAAAAEEGPRQPGGKVEAAPGGTAPPQKKLRPQPLEATGGECGGVSSATPTPAEDVQHPPSTLAGPAGGHAEQVSAGS